MKRILILFSAAAVLFSCTKVTPEVVKEEINFTPVAGKVATKVGPIVGTTYATTAPTFGSFAYKGSDLYIPESEISYQTDKWKAGVPYYWPADGNALTFYSYSPYAINTSVTCDASKGIIISDYDVYSNQEHDVMVAGKVDNATAATYGTSGVSTVFAHKLAYIAAINFKTADDYRKLNGSSQPQTGDKKFTVKKVQVVGALHTGTYTQIPTSGTEGWTTSGSVAGKDWYSDSNGTVLTNTSASIHTLSYLFVMPQTFTDDVKILIDYTVDTYNGTDYVTDTVTGKEIALKTTAHTKWEMGKKYTYDITFTLNEIYWAPSVTEWTAENVSGYNIQ